MTSPIRFVACILGETTPELSILAHTSQSLCVPETGQRHLASMHCPSS